MQAEAGVKPTPIVAQTQALLGASHPLVIKLDYIPLEPLGHLSKLLPPDTTSIHCVCFANFGRFNGIVILSHSNVESHDVIVSGCFWAIQAEETENPPVSISWTLITRS